MSELQLSTVESEVPYADLIAWWLKLNEALRTGDPIYRSHRNDPHYLAWEDVRLERNPFFAEGTGFEGYFIDGRRGPAEVLELIIANCRRMLDSIVRYHPHDWSWRSRMMKTLTGEKQDPQAIAEWSALLGATLGRLRAEIIQNPAAQHFHDETYNIVQQLPLIAYHANAQTPIQQRYQVGAYLDSPKGIICIDPSLLKPSEQDAWRVAQLIGKFGHPLVREFVRRSAR